MTNIVNFFVLLLTNLVYTNFFFIKFEQSDFTIAIQGLNNFSEDLNDLGFPVGFQLNYFYFAIIVALFVTIAVYYSVLKNPKLSDPIDFLKSILKIGFINFSILTIVLYIFRFFNFPRVYILLNVILYPLIMSLLVYLLGKNTGNVETFSKIRIIFLPTLLAFTIYLIVNQVSSESVSTEVGDSEDVNNEVDIVIPIQEQDNIVCYKWAGSSNYKGCKEAKKLKKINVYNENQVNNFVIFESDLFTVLKSGLILRNGEVFLDITSQVSEDASEKGLYDIAFHPNQNYFLISFSNQSNDLEIEKHEYDENFNISNSKSILRIPNSTFSHYCGSLAWSENFNTFLYCVGDLGYENLSLSTNVKNGKILLLDSEIITNSPLISESENQLKSDNIVAYGLRNPWNFLEYNDLLVIPDVGNKSMEEVNFVELGPSKGGFNSILFGWPVYEGTILSEDRFYGLKLWDSPEKELYDFVIETSTSPRVFYNRPAPENSRVAILGTVVLENPDSFFNKNFIFADFLSKEIFAYNYQTDELFVINLPYFPGYITSIGNHPIERSKILFSTSNNGNSEVYELELP